MSAVVPGTALVPYFGAGDDGTLAWLRLSRPERRRTAMQAAHEAGADFAATATKLGLKVVPLRPMTADGKTGVVDAVGGGQRDPEVLGVGRLAGLQ